MARTHSSGDPLTRPRLSFDKRRYFGHSGRRGYHARVLGLLGRRAIDLAVLFLAVYAFAFVPLGKRTGLEHLRAILETRPARDAGHEIVEAADKLRARLLGGGDELPKHGVPVVPKLPRRSPEAPVEMRVAPRDVPDASL